MAITLAQMADAVRTTLEAADGIQSAASYDEIHEGINSIDCPRIEVYPERGDCDPSGNADRFAFNAGAQLSVIVINVDLYARQRSQLDEDLGAYVAEADALIDILQEQEKPPFFGVEGIQPFSWGFRRTSFRRSGALFAGARFEIRMRVF